MDSKATQELFEHLTAAGWTRRDNALFAPNGTMWLEQGDPWAGDLPSLRDRMVSRLARIVENANTVNETDALDVEQSRADVESLVIVLNALLRQ